MCSPAAETSRSSLHPPALCSLTRFPRFRAVSPTYVWSQSLQVNLYTTLDFKTGYPNSAIASIVEMDHPAPTEGRYGPIFEVWSGVRMPTGATLQMTAASKNLTEGILFPPNFTTFGNFLQPTTTWIVLTKPSSGLLCKKKKKLGPLKSGINRKRSDLSDLRSRLIFRWRQGERERERERERATFCLVFHSLNTLPSHRKFSMSHGRTKSIQRNTNF